MPIFDLYILCELACMCCCRTWPRMRMNAVRRPMPYMPKISMPFILASHVCFAKLLQGDITVKLLQDANSISSAGNSEPEAWNDQIGHHDQIQHVSTLATLV